MQRFEGGNIYAVRSGTSIVNYLLWGPTSTLYQNLGEAAGKLGSAEVQPGVGAWWLSHHVHQGLHPLQRIDQEGHRLHELRHA